MGKLKLILMRSRFQLASGGRSEHITDGRASMRHYRVNKLAKAGGAVIKKKDVLAPNDRQAVKDAAESDDCPVCDVFRDGQKIGSIT